MPGYAANTAQNVAAGPTVAPVSLATDLAIATIFAVVGVTVYLLLRRIDRRAAGRRVVFAAVAAGMILVNLAFHHAALLFAAGPGSTAVGAQNSDGLVVLLLGMFLDGPLRGRSARSSPEGVARANGELAGAAAIGHAGDMGDHGREAVGGR